jgi:hypothetical protein
VRLATTEERFEKAHELAAQLVDRIKRIEGLRAAMPQSSEPLTRELLAECGSLVVEFGEEIKAASLTDSLDGSALSKLARWRDLLAELVKIAEYLKSEGVCDG